MDLLPCPFCGGEAKYAVIEGARYSHVVECKGCASTAGGSTFPNEKYNAEKWNTRSNPQADALAEAANAIVEDHFLRGSVDVSNFNRLSTALAAYEEGKK